MRISYIICLLFTVMLSSVAWAEGQNINQGVKTMELVPGHDGATLFRANCQSCHMPNGEGVATGAGMYPALANNPNLSTPDYTAFVIMNGLRGMPSLSNDLSDADIAAVTNFVVTNFGNNSQTKITEKEVREMRPAHPISYE